MKAKLVSIAILLVVILWWVSFLVKSTNYEHDEVVVIRHSIECCGGIGYLNNVNCEKCI